MAEKTYTNEEYAAMEVALAERNAKLAEEAAKLAAEMKAREDAQLTTIRTWLASDHVQAVRDEFLKMLPELRTIPRIAVYAYDFLHALDQAAGPLPAKPEIRNDAQ